jgi:hypothetical protein
MRTCQYFAPLLLAVLGLSAASFAQGAPDPDEVYIQNINYGGTGCPQGTVAHAMANDRQSMTLIFDQFIASIGPGIENREARKNCTINVNLHVPQGWSYAIGTFDFRGYVQLDAGVRGTQRAIFHHQGGGRQGASQTSFVGPVARDYLLRDTIGLQSLVWSNCGATRPLVVNTQLHITSDDETKRGQMTTDSIDGKFSTILGISWKPC